MTASPSDAQWRRNPESKSAAWWADLRGEASSDAANRFVEAVFTELMAALPTGKKPRKNQDARRREALAAIVADLLWAAKEHPRKKSALQLRKKKFSGQYITYHSFKPVFSALVAARLVQWERGSNRRDEFEADAEGDYIGAVADPNEGGGGIASRVRATALLFDLAAKFGITPQSADEHFNRRPPKHVLELRRSKQGYQSDPTLGKAMSFTPGDKTREIAEEVNSLNQFLGEFTLENCPHRGFYRIFNCGDWPDFDWNKGGRLYSHARNDSYQNLPEKKRLQMLISGSPVAEIDIRASFLTILYGLLKTKPQWTDDPYDVPEIKEREVVKKWITITLGHTQFHDRWPKGTTDDLKRVIRRSLSKEYPILKVGAAIMRRHPIIRRYHRSRYTVFDLMFVESKIIMNTMYALMINDRIPSLPIHDSIIVRERDVPIALRYLSWSFHAAVGISPIMKTTYADGREVVSYGLMR